MNYNIIANPVSGTMTIDQKHDVLEKAAEILDAELYGLDTGSSDEFIQCAKACAEQCDVMVIAGGDGTLSDIINVIDTTATPIAFLPLGTGNAMQYALNYRGNIHDIALRIKDGEIYPYDLVSCQGKRRAFMSSVGIEGVVIRLRDQYVRQGYTGFKAYFRASVYAYFKSYRRATVNVIIDDKMFDIKNLLSLMIVKQPYYGSGMKVVPEARFDDRRLHIRWINSGLLKSLAGVTSAFTIGNRIGSYHTGQKLTLTSDRPLLLQIDGNIAWDSKSFEFSILPKALKIKC